MVPNHSHGTLLGGSSHLVLVGRALSWFYLIHKSVLTPLMKWENPPRMVTICLWQPEDPHYHDAR